MPRKPRCIEPGVPYHVTQRGVDRTKVFLSRADRLTYLGLFEKNLEDTGVSVLSYCLMTNHIHAIVVPHREDSLAVLFRRVHGRFAQFMNTRRFRNGHLWQNRFYSCPLARTHLWTALRYVEWNPVRAGMVQVPEQYEWSTASAHLEGPTKKTEFLDWNLWRQLGGSEGWREAFGATQDAIQEAHLRRSTHSGRPFGDESFIHHFEERFGRYWLPQGRPKSSVVVSA